MGASYAPTANLLLSAVGLGFNIWLGLSVKLGPYFVVGFDAGVSLKDCLVAVVSDGENSFRSLFVKFGSLYTGPTELGKGGTCTGIGGAGGTHCKD